ncbi:MAG: septation protein A [Bordetella sp.]|jgi:intracellular septation protein
MKLFADWLPLVAFFVLYKAVDIYAATAGAIILSLLMIGLMRWRGLPIDKMQWISLGLIVVFGGATLFLQDERFIKAKPSLLYLLFGLVLVVPHLLKGIYLIEKLMAGRIELPTRAWRRLNMAWALFFIAMAALNAWVASVFSTDIWVDFKVFGTLGLTLAFVVVQALYMGRFMKSEPDESAES